MENTTIEVESKESQYLQDLVSDDVETRITTILEILDTTNISLQGSKYKELMRSEKNEWITLYLKHANKSNVDDLVHRRGNTGVDDDRICSPMVINIPQEYRKKCVCKNELTVPEYGKHTTTEKNLFEANKEYELFVMFEKPNVSLTGDKNVFTHWVNTDKGWYRLSENKFNFYFNII